MNRFTWVKDGNRNMWRCLLNGIEYTQLNIERYSNEEVKSQFPRRLIERSTVLARANALKKAVYEIWNCADPKWFETLAEAKAFVKSEYGNYSTEELEWYKEEV